MSQSLSNIQLHLVFSTKNRRPLIVPEIEEQLYAYISKLCDKVECKLISIGGTSNHIHILLALGRNTSIAKVVQHLKANSSKWLHENGHKDFSWQSGYGVFSIGESAIEQCSKYIANQKQHHTKISFEDEYRSILNKYNIKYDEQYLWN